MPPAPSTAASIETILAEHREHLGAIVRAAWQAWARTQPSPKPSWLTGWDDLDSQQREADMQLGLAVAAALIAMIGPWQVSGDDDGDYLRLMGPCAKTIGCLSMPQFSYHGATLAELIAFALEHQGGQGDQLHAELRALAAQWDQAADAANQSRERQP